MRCAAVVLSIEDMRTDGVRGLHLEGNCLARHYRDISIIPVSIERECDVRVFTKICMFAVLLDLGVEVRRLSEAKWKTNWQCGRPSVAI